MKSKTYLFYVIMLYTICSFAQEKQYSLADTVLADKGLEKTLSQLRANHLDSARIFADEALKIYTATVGPESKGVSFCYYYIASIYIYSNNFEKAKEYYQKALNIQTKVLRNDNVKLGDSYVGLGVSYYYTGDINNAADCYIKADEIFNRNQEKNIKKIANNLSNLGSIESQRHNHPGAIKLNQKTLDIFSKYYKPNDPIFGDVYFNMGVSYYHMGNFKDALKYYNLGATVLLPVEDKFTDRLASIWNNIGTCYNDMGDHNKALDYFNKGLITWLKNPNKNSRYIAQAHLNLSDCYHNMNVSNKAIDESKKALDIALKLPVVNKHFIPACYTSLSNVYEDLSDYQKAKEYALEALNNYLPNVGNDSSDLISYLVDVGKMSFKCKEFNNAKYYLNRGLKQAEKDEVVIESARIIAYQTLGEISALENDFDQAFKYYKTALDLIGFKDPESGSLSLIRYYFNLHNKLSDLYYNRYKETKNNCYLQELKQSNADFENVVNSVRNEMSSGGKSNFSKITKHGFENIIKTALIENEDKLSERSFDDIFRAFEATKSLSLLESQIENYALANSSIPDSILDEEIMLKSTINYYRKEKELLSKSSASLNEINDKIFTYQKKYEDFIKSLEGKYPKYYNLKYNRSLKDITQVKELLTSNDEAILEYFIGDEDIYILTITKAEQFIKKIKIDNSLYDLVNKMRYSTTAYKTNKFTSESFESLCKLYVETSNKLYQLLIKPVASGLPKHVIIIPDEILGYIPFESLVVDLPSNPVRFNQHHYLLNDHVLSYGYSANMLLEMHHKKNRIVPTISLTSFAPYYTGDTSILNNKFSYSITTRKDLNPLPYSGEEASQISKLMKGRALIGKDAVKENFIKLAPESRIIHLATHGQANDYAGDYCFLVFAEIKDSIDNELLYASDIYNLQLNADLVTLSACETGLGELKKGEGIISLSRAFTYAGAKSIVTSLWQISDVKTKELMIDFYKNLQKGMPKDDALWQAKIDYISKNKGEAASPFYWAAFIGIGDMSKIN